MSLLMDALRRAEKEKKAQQERAAATAADSTAAIPDPDQTRDAGLDIGGETTAVSPRIGSEDATIQIEPEAIEQAEAAHAAASSTVDAPTPDDHDATSLFADDLDQSQSLNIPAGVLELEAADETGAGKLALEPMESAAGEAAAAVPSPGAADLTGGTTVGVQERHEQTATMPSTRAVENDLNSYFDQSQSVQAPRPRSGDLTLEDVAAHTVVNANTVFAAGERKRSRPLLLAIAVIAVVVVLGIGAVGLFYAQQSAAPQYIPPPTVADGVEHEVVRDLPVVPLETAPAQASMAPTMPSPAQVDTLASVETTAAVTMPPPTVATGPATTPGEIPATSESTVPPPASAATAATSGDSGPAAPVEALVANTPGSAESGAAPATTEPAATEPATTEPATTQPAAHADVAPAPPRAAAPASLADVNAGEVRIARSRGPRPADEQAATGYRAFQAGDMAAARAAYQAALADDPDQRDALLGLGALAMREGNARAAYDYYARVLDQRPDDVVASTAMFSLSGGTDAASAARLRLMLDRFGESPQLHFALGNWYARQQRWGDAQQAYFDAMRLDDTNADFAYNLAVSLDHLGQQESAVRYYQQSLSLADETGAGFNPSSALERIQALSAGE